MRRLLWWWSCRWPRIINWRQTAGRTAGLVVVGIPSVRTVHKILTEQACVEASPAKRPHNTDKRFEALSSNGMWQIDGLADGQGCRREVAIVRVIDDHSRKILPPWPRRSRTRAWSGRACRSRWSGTAMSDNGRVDPAPHGALNGHTPDQHNHASPKTGPDPDQPSAPHANLTTLKA